MADDDDLIRASWQGRVLAHARGSMMFAVTSMLAHSFDDDMPYLLNAVRPLCWDPANRTLIAPFLCSIGRINHAGQIEAKAISRSGQIGYALMFYSTSDYESQLRSLADIAQLTDEERVMFFATAVSWVGSDQRLDPMMDPRDPDARRLVH